MCEGVLSHSHTSKDKACMWLYRPHCQCVSSTSRCLATHLFYLHHGWLLMPFDQFQKSCITSNYFKSLIFVLLAVKGCGMGPLLVLVSPCFRENVVVTCKIWVFFMKFLDTLLQKNVIVFFIKNQISKWRSFEKRAIFDLLFTFLSYRAKVTKNPSAPISLTYIHIFCSPYWLFALPI